MSAHRLTVRIPHERAAIGLPLRPTGYEFDIEGGEWARGGRATVTYAAITPQPAEAWERLCSWLPGGTVKFATGEIRRRGIFVDFVENGWTQARVPWSICREAMIARGWYRDQERADWPRQQGPLPLPE